MAAEDKPSDLVQGTLHMLILKTLALEPMHAYGIGARLRTDQQGRVPGQRRLALPALRRLERDGFIEGDWKVTENNRRAKVYRMTAQGRARFKNEARDWEVQTAAISKILKASLGEL
jgi:PadR family transcriptional regulator, regulatory protein PadR